VTGLDSPVKSHPNIVVCPHPTYPLIISTAITAMQIRQKCETARVWGGWVFLKATCRGKVLTLHKVVESWVMARLGFCGAVVARVYNM